MNMKIALPLSQQMIPACIIILTFLRWTKYKSYQAEKVGEKK